MEPQVQIRVIPMRDENRELREFIHEQMRVRGWNYAEFARAVGVDGSVVSRWIRDRKPEPEKVQRMAVALGVDFDHLMTIVGHRPPTRAEVSPEHAALIEKIQQMTLSKERYLILDTLLEDLRRRDPS